MPYNNVGSVILVMFWLCSFGDFAVVISKNPLQSHITGGYKNSLIQQGVSAVDCNQFSNNYDVLRQFPFPILVNQGEQVYYQSSATMNDDGIFVNSIYLRKEEVVPPSIFCLSKLQTLHIDGTPFLDGIVPDTLENLKLLHYLWIYNSSIVKMTEQLGTLRNLSMLILSNCALTQLPKLKNLKNLWSLDLPKNRLSKIEELPGVLMMDLSDNLFNKIPTIEKKENLEGIDMSNNPLESIEPFTSYVNLTIAILKNTTLTFIPPAIDRLENLKYLDVSDNKLSRLPMNIVNLPHLETLNIKNNLLSDNDIQSIRNKFRTSHPNTEILS